MVLKKIWASSILFALPILNFAFDWPQNEILSDSFFSYFAQFRGGVLSPSLVFSDTETVKCAGDGRVMVVMEEHPESDIFESALGNSVVIFHGDEMATVYGNLDDVSSMRSASSVKSGDEISQTALSGWQEGNACLEFQVLDMKSKSYINPRVLMPRFGGELELVLHDVSAVSKAGVSFSLNSVSSMNAGTYLIYNERQDVAVPYICKVFINGVAVESLSYDSLYEIDGMLNVKGKDFHPLSQVYPDSRRILLGEISIPRGHNELTVVLTDILGKEYQAKYMFDAR